MKKTKKELIEKIERIAEEKKEYYNVGLRTIRGNEEVGVSYSWEDGECLGTELPGLCTIGLWKDEEKLVSVENALKALEAYPNEGGGVCVVWGWQTEYGEDKNELIIKPEGHIKINLYK